MSAFPLAINACSALLQEQNGDWEEVGWGFLPEPSTWLGGTGRDELWMLSSEFAGVTAAVNRAVHLAAASVPITTITEWQDFVSAKFPGQNGGPNRWRYVTAPAIGLGTIENVNGYSGAGPAPLTPADRNHVEQLDTGSIGLYSPAGDLIGAVYTGTTSGSLQRTENWILGSEYDPQAPQSEAVVMRPYPQSYANAPDFLAAFRQESFAHGWDMVMVQNIYTYQAPS